MKKSIRLITLVILAGVFFTFTACNQSDTATVKINVGAPSQARIQKPMIFDKILAFILLGGPAQADPAPGDWYVLELTVDGPGMNTINESIPWQTGEITLEVPAGSARKFTVVAINDGWRQYGGIETADLSPGSSTTLNIYMGDLPWPPENFNVYQSFPTGAGMNWSYSEGEPLGLIGFVIYRSPQSGGPYVPIADGTKEFFNNDGYRYTDPEGITSFPNPSYYKVSATNQFGEGDPGFENYYAC